MYNKVLKIANYETATPLLPYKAVIRSYMASKFGYNPPPSEDSSKTKSGSETTTSLRYICPSQDTLKLRNKVRSLVYNCLGTRLYISTRDTVYLFNTQWMSLEHTIAVKSTTLIAHPKYADVFALLIQGSAHSNLQ